MAPKMLARKTKYIHLFRPQLMPSFFEVCFSNSMPSSATVTPAHCHTFRCSAKIIIAPISTITGRVALIGPTIVNGRFLRPK